MIKNITNVKGFTCWGAHTGVKSMKRDLAIIYSEVPASAAAVFTLNEVKAEPIKISQENIKDGLAQAIVINSGNANACTGKQGRDGANAMIETMASELGIDKSLVLVASTGLIGEKFPTEEIITGIKENVKNLSSRSNAGSFVANAILTTDTYAKEGFVEFEADGFEINMGGIAKGSGMIHPNMGTMLAFIVTDIAINSALLQETVKEIVDKSFNMITIDGDTSTNDMVAVLANGMANNTKIKGRSYKGYEEFRDNLEQMMMHLAKLIVSDGEGASKFITYQVTNARDKSSAKKLIRAISDSTLVKTALYGRDPNWGRIICAAGNAGIPFNYEDSDLYLGDENTLIKVLEKGVPQDYNRNFMKKLLRESHISVKLDMNMGEVNLTGWGSDLTTDYVMFNSVYTT